jgi:hypothetical protein
VLRIVFAVALLFLVIVTTASGAVLDEIARDFKPLSGYVIMPVDGEYLIDKDASHRVSVGDLFTVVKPGEKIIHPVTKEVLGTLDEVKGTLQVTRLKSGYSYARPVGANQKVERGDVITRYEKIPALFWDYTGKGQAFFGELKSTLPALEWQDYAVAQADRPQVPSALPEQEAALVFILRHDGLEVRDGRFQTLHAYPVPGELTAAASAATPNMETAAAAAGAVGATLEERLLALEQQARIAQGLPAPESNAPYRLEDTQAASKRGVAYEAAFPGFKSLGNLAEVTHMADFLRDGDRLLMAATDGKQCQIYEVDEKLAPLARADTSYAANILAVHWWRPTPAGAPMLAVTAWSGRRVESALFALQGERLVLLAEHLPSIFGAFDRDGDGVAELLLSQSFDAETFFGHRISEMRLVKGELEFSSPTFDLPRDFTVQGSLFVDLTGDGRLETVTVRHGFLRVYDGKKELYKTPKQMGGSLSSLSYPIDPDSRDPQTGFASFEVPPVAVDLDGDGQRELVAVASDRSSFGAPGVGPGVKKSWLSVLKYRDGMFVKGTIGEELDTPLQGLHVTADRVLFVATEPPSMLGQGGASHLLSFPLSR